MDNQDKIFDKFKEASHNAEAKDFPAMEKVWSRVEEKLDKKEDKKTISLWKKIAVAASLLLVISLGSQFIKSDKNTGIQNQEVVVNEKSEANKTQSTIEKSDAVVSSSEIVPKAEATQILEKQINREPVAINEVQSLNNPVITTQAAPAMGSGIAITPQAEVGSDENESYNNNSLLKENKASANHYLQADKKASFDMAKDENRAKVARKPAPLVVLNGSAIAHSDAAKKDKMMRNELPNLRPENVDSLVILDEPLYIIDGIYYSENDLFGDNPTSPYAPLDKQDIKTMTILQDLEATSKYGEKGKKGVVIITTKNGKPSLKK